MLSATHSPAEFAARHGCKVDKVLGWIDSKELAAINTAANPHGAKPRWRITEEAIADFERRRSTVVAAPSLSRKKRQDAEVIQFFK